VPIYATTLLRAFNTLTIYFVLLPVGHLTSSIAVPDTLAGCTAERLVAFEAIGAVVGRLFLCGDRGAPLFLRACGKQ